MPCPRLLLVSTRTPEYWRDQQFCRVLNFSTLVNKAGMESETYASHIVRMSIRANKRNHILMRFQGGGEINYDISSR